MNRGHRAVEADCNPRGPRFLELPESNASEQGGYAWGYSGAYALADAVAYQVVQVVPLQWVSARKHEQGRTELFYLVYQTKPLFCRKLKGVSPGSGIGPAVDAGKVACLGYLPYDYEGREGKINPGGFLGSAFCSTVRKLIHLTPSMDNIVIKFRKSISLRHLKTLNARQSIRSTAKQIIEQIFRRGLPSPYAIGRTHAVEIVTRELKPTVLTHSAVYLGDEV